MSSFSGKNRQRKNPTPVTTPSTTTSRSATAALPKITYKEIMSVISRQSLATRNGISAQALRAHFFGIGTIPDKKRSDLLDGLLTHLQTGRRRNGTAAFEGERHEGNTYIVSDMVPTTDGSTKYYRTKYRNITFP